MSTTNNFLPVLYMMVGLPGSGKSTYANKLCEDNKNIVIHSSDKLREELYGDENTQEHNSDVFTELHNRIKSDLSDGKSVIYDATNIGSMNRMNFLKSLKNINCKKVCIYMMTSLKTCLQQNIMRERHVPEDVIRRMYRYIMPPIRSEGFDKVIYIKREMHEKEEL